MVPAVIYVRVSSDKQAEEGYSLPSQEKACRAYAESHDMCIIETCKDQETGSTMNRPGLMRVRELCRSGAAKALIVYAHDRLNRDLGDSLILSRELQRLGIEIHYAKEGRKLGKTMREQLPDSMQWIIAEIEREDIKERTERGRREKVASGLLNGHGRPPYGYERHIRLEGKRKIIEYGLHDVEAPVVRNIFHWFVFGDGYGPLTVSQIAQRLSQQRVPTPGDRIVGNTGFTKRRGYGEWSSRVLYEILTRPAYKGKAAHFRNARKRGENVTRHLPQKDWKYVDVPAIVDEPVWEKAQELLAQGRLMSTRNTKYEYLLARRLLCECTYHMHAIPKMVSTGGKKVLYAYYTCNGRKPAITARRCDMKPVPVSKLDRCVWNWVEATLLDEDELERKLREYYQQDAERQADLLEKQQVLANELAAVDAEQDRLLNLWLKQKIRDDQYEKTNQELEAHRERLMQELDAVDKQTTTKLTEVDITAVRLFALALKEGAANADFQARRRIIDALDVVAELQRTETGLAVQVTSRVGAALLSPDSGNIAAP